MMNYLLKYKQWIPTGQPATIREPSLWDTLPLNLLLPHPTENPSRTPLLTRTFPPLGILLAFLLMSQTTKSQSKTLKTQKISSVATTGEVAKSNSEQPIWNLTSQICLVVNKTKTYPSFQITRKEEDPQESVFKTIRSWKQHKEEVSQ